MTHMAVASLLLAMACRPPHELHHPEFLLVSSPVSTAARCLVSSNPSDGLASFISDAITVRRVVVSGFLMTVMTFAMDALPDEDEKALMVTTAGWSDIIGEIKASRR